MNACGQTVTILTYRVDKAEDFEKAILLISKKEEQFAVQIGQGTATMSSGFSLVRKTQVLLLGHSPINRTDLGTTIDLRGTQINVDDSNICFQDLSLVHGKVCCRI